MGYRLGIGIGLILAGLFLMVFASANSARGLFRFGLMMASIGAATLVMAVVIEWGGLNE